jgi:hypothetical protein
MSQFCEKVTNHTMKEKDYKDSENKNKMCLKCLEKGQNTEIKFEEAYNCGELKLDKEDIFNKIAYEQGKSNLNNDIKFMCLICKITRKEIDKFTAATCCFGEYCSICRDLIVKSQYLRAKESKVQYKCPICKTDIPLGIAAELLSLK